jgi:hypothetical protein
MAESKARSWLRDLAATGRLAPLPGDVTGPEMAQAARDQGLAGVLLDAIEKDRPSWAAPLAPTLAARRRADLVRTLGQVGLAARALALLESRGVRALPLKGAALAETVYDVESDRPMSDVDVLALERWAEATAALRDAGFVEVARGDHAWAFRDPEEKGILELHRSIVSAPGLFPLDVEGLWARSRRGRGQLGRLPSAEDLLVSSALHAAFQHGLTLTLVQWLDFRRVLEREPIDASRLGAIAASARAEVPLGAALLAAEAVVRAPLAAPIRPRLPSSLLRWLEPRLADPLGLVAPSEPRLARARWELLPGRRAELLWRTLVLPETPGGDAGLPARVAFAFGRGLRLARGLPPESPPVAAHDLGEPPAVAAGAEVPFGEEVLRDCLASFPHVRLTVTGRCMEPALRHGEKVLLVAASRRRPRLGDVVLARQSEALRLHRLVWGPPLARASAWRTKADRGLRLDPPLAAADVLASVAAVEGRPAARPRRAARALLSLAAGIAARLRMGGARAEASP